MSKLVNYQPQNNETDWSKVSVNKYSSNLVTTVANANIFTTVLNVTGQGYLKKYIVPNASGTGRRYIRITVDGVQTVLLTNYVDSSSYFGICLEELITCNSNGAGYIRIGGNSSVIFYGNIKTYPDTSSTGNIIQLPQPIYFKNSLLIEVSSSYAETFQVEYSYCVI